jgi:hypothetical protein
VTRALEVNAAKGAQVSVKPIGLAGFTIDRKALVDAS